MAAGRTDYTGHGAAGRKPALTTDPRTSARAATIGTVAALYLRRAHGAPPEAVPCVHVQAEAGLAGDVHLNALSPRQLLLAGAPAYARLGLPPNALRENMLLDLDTASLASGQLLAVGATAVLRLTFACEPCGQLNLRQPQLTRSIGVQRGMLARVLHGGAISVGDSVCLMPATLPTWPDDWRARVETVLTRVPEGMVVEYRHLALLAGVALTYCRVFPRVARDMGLAHKAVPLRSACSLPRWNGAGLFD